MAKEYRLVWNDQQGKLVVTQEQARAERKQFAARIMATALAATALTTFGASEAQAAPTLCLETYTTDKVLAADTTTTGPVCYEQTLTIETGAVVANDINGGTIAGELDFAPWVIGFRSGTAAGNLTNNGSILGTYTPAYEGMKIHL